MSTEVKKTKIFPYVCRICGSAAEYSYFGAIACQSCKVFFKRNGQRDHKAFVCRSDGQCQINPNNRRICRSCRLAKCFESGMSTDKFRGPIQKKSETKTLVKVQHQLEIFPTLNLLRSDQSLLTSSQWILLSNLLNCYKESQMLPFIQRLKDRHNSIRSTTMMYKSLVDEFLGSVYETAGIYLRSNDDLRKLSSDDRSIILHSAADNVCCMGGAFIMQHCFLYGLDTFLSIMNAKYGKHTMDIHVQARKFIDPDVVLVKLTISLFAFSENTCCYYSDTSKNLTNPIHILEIQNKYAEVTWKYLIYKYGYSDAVRRFLNLTLWLASINTLAVHAQSLPIHLNDIDSIIEQTELTLILDDIDEIVDTNQ